MSATDALSPQQLGEHVRALATSGKVITDRGSGEDFPIHELATNSSFRCGDASETVEEHLQHRGVRTRGLDFDTGIPHMANHYATEVHTSAGPHVVDLAYSQYDDAFGNTGRKRAPWPLVEPKPKYLKRSGFKETS